MGAIKLQIICGGNTLGANKILLRDENYQIYLDYGKCSKEKHILKEYFIDINKTIHLLDQHSILNKIDRNEKISKENSIIIITHAHADHYNEIWELKESIPIYCSLETRMFLEKLAKIKKKKLNFVVLPKSVPLFFGNFEIQAIHSDHNIPGNLSIVIKNKDFKILYTGDFRFHGFDKKLAEHELFSINGIDLLICDGTRINENKIESEKENCIKIKEWMQKSKKFILLELPTLDFGRFLRIVEISKELGKKIIVSTKINENMKSLWELKPNIYPNPKQFVNIKSRAFLSSFGLSSKNFNYILVFSRDEIKEVKKLLKKIPIFNQATYICATSFPHKIKHIKNEIQLQHFFNKKKVEYQISSRNFKNKQYFLFKRFHTSGHASKPELQIFIQHVNPKFVIPIHSNEPIKLLKITH
ncbi:MBL fold metallo-hydrolase [Candidatus Harpocratesius sp.]